MEALMKNSVVKEIMSYIFIMTACLVSAFGLTVFMLTAGIAPGGFTGIAAIINHFISFPIGMITLALNIPFLIFAVIKWGIKFVIKTACAVVCLSVFMDLLSGVAVITHNPLLSAVYGGLFNGVGLGIVLINGGSGGGSDILAYGIQQRFKQWPIGRILLGIDVIVFILYALITGNVESALYAGIAKFIGIKIVNILTSGGHQTKTFMIITNQPQKISKVVHSMLGRGATQFEGVGMYKGDDVNMLLVVVRRNEAHKLRKIVLRLDSSAFMILTDSSEVWGKGFLMGRH